MKLRTAVTHYIYRAFYKEYRCLANHITRTLAYDTEKNTKTISFIEKRVTSLEEQNMELKDYINRLENTLAQIREDIDDNYLG